MTRALLEGRGQLGDGLLDRIGSNYPNLIGAGGRSRRQRGQRKEAGCEQAMDCPHFQIPTIGQ